MSIPVQAIRLAQQRLGFGEDATDGVLGPITDAALRRALEERRAMLSLAHSEGIFAGGRQRRLVAFLQIMALDQGIATGPVDGFYGPQTAYAVAQLLWLETHGRLPGAWRDWVPPANPNGWPVEREADLAAFYGQPGDESQLVMVDLPYPHRLSWDLATRVERTRCHQKVAAALVRVLGRVLAEYGRDRIRELHLDRFGGCFNVRRKRGGTARSTHAWGIAMDYDPDRNALQWGRDRAAFARPSYDAWWHCWEEEGWVSLGRSANFDWMHVQAARRL